MPVTSVSRRKTKANSIDIKKDVLKDHNIGCVKRP